MFHRFSIVRSIRPKVAAKSVSSFETLERRQLLSSATISYSDFSSTAGLTANGFGSTAPTSSGALVMTDSNQNEARSIFYNTPVPFDHFTTHFTYRADSGAQADGLTFALQENGPTALGGVGGSLGYQGINGNSVAVGFDILGDYYAVFSGSNLVFRSTGMDANPPTPIQVGNGDTYDIAISYDGTTLNTSIVDPGNSANDYSNAYAINLNSALGANTAYVGFTAGDGSLVSTQRISNWNYSGNDGLTITTPAAANPDPVTGTTTALSVGATDTTNGGTLNYNWTLLHKPSGAANPTFTSNDSPTANDTNAQFYKDGTYIFRATASNTNGLFDVSDVSVVVQQTATAVRASPHAQTIARNSKKTYSATITDQFGHPMRTQPAIVWSMLQGNGSINSSTGLFTAGSEHGHDVIECTDTIDALTGTVGATII